jgi:ferredoxin
LQKATRDPLAGLTSFFRASADNLRSNAGTQLKETKKMRIVVALNRCQGYAQCVPLAPTVLKLNGEKALMYGPNPDDSLNQQVLRAAASCPVQAIIIDRLDEKAALVADLVTEFMTNGRIVIVRASLAGLRAAETLRDEGFNGTLTIIGDEKHEPYDRPPLSKQVLKGWVRADHTLLPRLRKVDADRRLGVGLDSGQGAPVLNDSRRQ